MKYLPDDVDRFGKFINLTLRLCFVSLSTNFLHCVVLPARSQPSSTINAPLTNCIFDFSSFNFDVFFLSKNITWKHDNMILQYFVGKGQVDPQK